MKCPKCEGATNSAMGLLCFTCAQSFVGDGHYLIRAYELEAIGFRYKIHDLYGPRIEKKLGDSSLMCFGGQFNGMFELHIGGGCDCGPYVVVTPIVKMLKDIGDIERLFQAGCHAESPAELGSV